MTQRPEDTPVNDADAASEARIAQLCDDLVSRGKLDQMGLTRASALSRSSGERLPVVLSRLGLVSETEIAETCARLFSLPAAAAEALGSATTLSGRISTAFLKKSHIAPIGAKDGELQIVMADPSDLFSVSALELSTGFKVSIFVGALSEVDAAVLSLVEAESPQEKRDPSDTLIEDVSRLRDIASEAPVVRYVTQVLESAVSRRASDIHFESHKGELRVRLRIDGVLTDMEPPPAAMRAAVISRLKILSKLDIAEQRLPQDGRITETIRGEEIDFRVATTPSLHGERVVLRVLDRRRVPLDFDALGFSADLLDKYQALLQQPHGILLVTGPTGSGKTTTLYASLAHLNRPGLNILTVEDPVEYEMQGLTQVNVKPEIGLTFAHVLRAFLRQDPDIMMVGEIRDLETAQIAVQAALTGHLVLATLHTNDAVSAVTRLGEMGIEDYLLAATLNGVVAQRLVRKLCDACAEPHVPDEALLARIGAEGKNLEQRFRRPVGCPECNGSGYKGRTSILELLPIDDRMRRSILTDADPAEIQKMAVETGMTPLSIAGIRLASQGVTSIDEVFRVTKA